MLSSLVWPDQMCYSAVLNVCASASRWQHAVGIVEKMIERQTPPDQISRNALLNACEKGAAWHAATCWLQRMQQTQLRVDPISFSAAIGACSKCQEWREVLNLLTALGTGGMRADRALRNAAAPGRWRWALSEVLTSRVVEEAPDEVTFRALLAGCFWSDALHLLQQMTRDRCSPNAICLSSCINACDPTVWPQAIGLLSGTLAVPNEICYNAAISLCDKAGELEMALQLLQQHGSDPGAYAAAMNAGARRGQWQMGLMLLAQMATATVTADEFCYGAAIGACERSHQWQVAIQLLEEMQNAQVPTSVVCVNSAISACEKIHQWQVALLLLASLGLDADLISVNAALSACARCGCWEQALALHDSVRARQLHPDTITRNALMTALETGSQWHRALDFLDSIDETQRDSITYATCLRACTLSHHWAAALRLLRCDGTGSGDGSINWATFSTVLLVYELGAQWTSLVRLLGAADGAPSAAQLLDANAARKGGRVPRWMEGR
ncbi:unnamed protein product [Durusdinium trenchii]